MKKVRMPDIHVFLVFAVLAGMSHSTNAQVIVTDIIENGAIPKVFLQEGVTTPNKQSAPAFTPDGKMLYISDNDTIKFSVLRNGKWVKPETVNFSGKWHDWDAALSPDGKIMVFVSDRPLPGEVQDKPQTSNQLWMTELISGNEWSVPRLMLHSINPAGISSYGPSISNKRTLYFSSTGRDAGKTAHAYYSKWLGGHYEIPVQLDLNGDKEVLDPFVAPDERYIIFKSGYDLYICYRIGEQWPAPYKLGSQVNNGGYNSIPRVSPDGKTLYYSSSSTSGILMIPIVIPKNGGNGNR